MGDWMKQPSESIDLVPVYVSNGLGSLADFRRAARRAADSHARTPVVVIPGDSVPVEIGDIAHYETGRGERVRYPLALSKRIGWRAMRYVRSTLRVTVGSLWSPPPGV